MRKILVSGVAGFIGSHIADALLRRGCDVHGLDNRSRPGADENLRYLKKSLKKGFQFYEADVRGAAAVEALFKEHGPFDAVIHEAGQVAVTTSVGDPRSDFETNAGGTFNMLEATRLHSPDAVFMFSSTNKVYGGMEWAKVQEAESRYSYADLQKGADEDCPLDFHSPYGCSKGCADQYVRDYSRIYGLRTIVLRQSCIYGTRQFGIEDQGWVAWFAIASILGRPITVYGDGKQVRDILWIDDLVDAYIALYESADDLSGEVFNVGGGVDNSLSLLELIEMLRAIGVLDTMPKFADWRAGDQRVYISDVSKLRRAASWSPKVSPLEGVKRLVKWVGENRKVLERLLL